MFTYQLPITVDPVNKLVTFLFITGLILLTYFGYLAHQRYYPLPNGLNQNNQFFNVSLGSHKSYPTNLIIKDLNINLAIYPAQKTGNLWETTNLGVSYLTSSPLPGNLGNSIIYGHNWPNLLGNLTKIKPADIVEIRYSDQTVRNFEVISTSIVPASETAFLKQDSSQAWLTLYTCTGFLDNNRFLVLAKLK